MSLSWAGVPIAGQVPQEMGRWVSGCWLTTPQQHVDTVGTPYLVNTWYVQLVDFSLPSVLRHQLRHAFPWPMTPHSFHVLTASLDIFVSLWSIVQIGLSLRKLRELSHFWPVLLEWHCSCLLPAGGSLVHALKMLSTKDSCSHPDTV